MGMEVMRLRVTQLVVQLKLCLSSFHCKVQSGSAKTPGPDIDDTLHILVEEGLLTLAEWDHYHKMLKVTAMAKLCKNLIQISIATDKTADQQLQLTSSSQCYPPYSPRA